MPRAKRKPAAPLRGRVRLEEAGAYLGCDKRTMWRRIAAGVFTYATPPDCRGKGRPAHVWWDEVECYLTEGEAACRDLRRRMRRDRD